MRNEPELEKSYSNPPLPEGWNMIEEHDDRFVQGKIDLKIKAYAAQKSQGPQATGSAVGADKEECQKRACAELLERIAILETLNEAPEELELFNAQGVHKGSIPLSWAFPPNPSHGEWAHAKSNGVAAHRSFVEAARASYLELHERDAFLRHWYGTVAPRACEFDTSSWELDDKFELRAVDLSCKKYAGDSTPVYTKGFFAFPKSPELPLSFGFASSFCSQEATQKAAAEALQRLAFLWNEEIPQSLDSLIYAANPLYHQDRYLVPSQHKALKEWLNGPSKPVFSSIGELYYINLTPPSLRGQWVILKAFCPNHLSLSFGKGHPLIVGLANEDRYLHPLA